jgi:hypothetical protein
MPIASDNNGNAWVANAFTTDPNSYPTAIYIQNNDYIACDADASTFSTSSNPLKWTTFADPVNTGDKCVKKTLNFHAQLGDSMLGMTITGLALDANMNPWFVLVDGATASLTAPNVVIVHYDGTTLSQYVSSMRQECALQ